MYLSSGLSLDAGEDVMVALVRSKSGNNTAPGCVMAAVPMSARARVMIAHSRRLRHWTPSEQHAIFVFKGHQQPTRRHSKHSTMAPNISLLGLALGLVICQSHAFTARPLVAVAPSTRTALFMSDKDKTKTLTSGKKEIAFDEASGRFFETGLDQDDCIPDEEYCMIDETTGNPIRLTVEEKERIFLDALQVCFVYVSDCSSLCPFVI